MKKLIMIVVSALVTLGMSALFTALFFDFSWSFFSSAVRSDVMGFVLTEVAQTLLCAILFGGRTADLITKSYWYNA